MDSQPQYAIMRCEKITGMGNLVARSKHNTRDTETGIEHTNPEQGIELVSGQRDIYKAWHNRIEEFGIEKDKIRKNANVGIEFFVSASPEWWKTATKEDVQDWITQSQSFMAEKLGGKKNLLQLTLHMDEGTPHLQGLGVPCVEKTVKARGQYGKDKPPKIKRTLSAKDLVGGHRSRLEDFQTEYHSMVSHLGLTRGRPRKETGAKNMRPSQWRAIESAKEIAKIEETANLLAEARKRLEAVEKREKAVSDERKALAKDAQSIINAQIIAKEPRDPEIVKISDKRFDVPKPSKQKTANPTKKPKVRDDDER